MKDFPEKKSSSKFTLRFTKEIKQKMREIAKTCEIQAKSLGFSLFLRENISQFSLFEMDFLWILKFFDVLERKMSPLSIYYDVYLRNMLSEVSACRFL